MRTEEKLLWVRGVSTDWLLENSTQVAEELFSLVQVLCVLAEEQTIAEG